MKKDSVDSAWCYPSVSIRFSLVLVLTASLSLSTLGQDQRSPNSERLQKIQFFETSVRPVLVKHCSKCHGVEKQESGLRVDDISFLRKGGDSGPAIVEGKPAESLLVAAIEHSDGLEMPPDRKLSKHEIQAIKKWIGEGATWPDVAVESKKKNWDTHWAFQKISKPTPPKANGDFKNFEVSNPIDQFILEQVAKRKLPVSRPANGHALVRRAYFDLHGVGPTYEQATQFVADQRPDRFGHLVDELLKSPRYGEMQARKWMDIARYADNKGYVFFEDKNYPWAYTYRDWLVKSFNRDMPFDEFITQQLAADLLTKKDNRQNLPALGFLTVGAKFVNNVHDQIDDRIDVVMRGLMGLTVSCARCHDHKFDPVPQADYYSLYGVFRSCYEPVILPTFGEEPTSEGFKTYEKGLNDRLEKLNQFIEGQRKQIIQGARSRIGEYLLSVHNRRHHPTTENFMTIADKGGLIPKVILRYEIYLERSKKNNDPIWIIWHAMSELAETEFAKQSKDKLQSLLRSKIPINTVIRKRFLSLAPETMKDVADVYGDVFAEIARLYESDNTLLTKDQQSLAEVLFGKDSPAVLPRILGWGFLDLIPDRPTQAVYQKLIKDVENFCNSGPYAPPRAMVLLDSDNLFEPYVFLRGNPNRKGEIVQRQFLTALPNSHALRGEFPADQSGRLQLAGKIASNENPLTARVIVNRIWRQHFGRGLVATPSDFGMQGALPSHPELLDWLSIWFMENDWSIKKLHKLIMQSAAYQLSSEVSPDQLAKDPENKWLSRHNRKRLDFESMRDSMLLATGSLDKTLGGKPFNLFNGFSNRRTIYGFINRMDLPGVLRTFDFPEPAATSAKREQTTVPAQALFFLNHQFVAQCSQRILQRKEIANAKTNADKIEAVFRAVHARNPNVQELELAKRFFPRKRSVRRVSSWQYGYGSFDSKTGKTTSFTKLGHYTGTHWQGGAALPDPKLNWLYHKNDESHPGASMKLCAIRRWVAPKDCTVAIMGNLKHEPTQGNGVNSRVISNRHGTLGSWSVHHSETKTNVSEFVVKEGDTLDFVSDFNSDIGYDQHKWMIVIESVEPEPVRWDSVKQFQGPSSSPWNSFVHALLMTNEFMFVD